MAGIELRSPAFSDHDLIGRQHAHDAEDLSPALEWSGQPDDAAELLIVCEDPDAPSGTFTHWMVAGIDPAVDSVSEDDVPAGAAQGRNDFGATGYAGPLPPIGDRPHRYFFHVYAVAEPSGLREGFDRAAFDQATSTELASGTLVGRYGR